MSEPSHPSRNTRRGFDLAPDHDPDRFAAVDPEIPEGESSPFDNLDNIRVDHNFLATAGVTTALTLLRVRKPHKEWFIRTHPDPAYQIDTYLLVLDEENESYYVNKSLWPELLGMETGFAMYRVRLAVSRQGTPFLWPIRLPGDDGKRSSWAESAESAAQLAEKHWIRLQSDRQLGGYRTSLATVVSLPIWPQQTFQELLKIAFRQKIIDTYDHLVLRRLRGEV